MVLKTLFNQKLRPVAIVSLVILGVGLIGSFVTTIVWWSRINPWFGKGRGIYRIVYNNVTACWVLTLVALVVLAVLVALDLFAKDTFDNLTGSMGGTMAVISIIGVFSLSGLITGAYASSYAIDRYHYKKSHEFEEARYKMGKHLCEGYFTQAVINTNSESMEDIYWGEILTELDEKDYEKYSKWLLKIVNKAFDMHPFYNGMVVLPFVKSYMCETVGVPTLIFTMIIGVSIIIFFYLIVISAFKDSGEQSEAEA